MQLVLVSHRFDVLDLESVTWQVSQCLATEFHIVNMRLV